LLAVLMASIAARVARSEKRTAAPLPRLQPGGVVPAGGEGLDQLVDVSGRTLLARLARLEQSRDLPGAEVALAQEDLRQDV
jgi:hypothetical protein